MKSTLPYFAVFYAIGIIIFGLFIRFWLSKKRLRDEEKKRGRGTNKKGKRANHSRKT
ncbi:MAG: hypothetical protein V3U24_00465 [Candidatus Neomarinimicrobiota bacterium]